MFELLKSIFPRFDRIGERNSLGLIWFQWRGGSQIFEKNIWLRDFFLKKSLCCGRWDGVSWIDLRVDQFVFQFYCLRKLWRRPKFLIWKTTYSWLKGSYILKLSLLVSLTLEISIRNTLKLGFGRRPLNISIFSLNILTLDIAMKKTLTSRFGKWP